MINRQSSKTYLANRLRSAVAAWRDSNYQGATPTSRRLLQFWFSEDHLAFGEPFSYWTCQREAIETLIYAYEVLKKRNFIDLARDFGDGPIMGYDPSFDQYPLYAFKMATGSGKTFVMALGIVWQYFNHQYEKSQDYTSKFLLIAGEKNVIYDRLCRDFVAGKIFKQLPLIPPEWEDDFNLTVITKEDPIHTVPEGVLFLTNIQQLEKREGKRKETDQFVDEVMALPEVKDVHDIYQENRIKAVLELCPDIAILKDEAHHIYSVEKEWKKILLNLHKKLQKDHGRGINMELDFSATPRNENGALFPWVISDFTLREAIEQNIVKRPLRGIVKKAEEIASKKAVERYRAWIDAGIRRWREYKKALTELNKKPVIFFQCSNNDDADEIFHYVNTVPDLKDKTLLIHTDSTGEIKKESIPQAREFAKTIDSNENPHSAIVSTMMLNEGWDVRNVNVIVGLRPYGGHRNVLAEQVIGRGLRKMFPNEPASTDPNQSAINILEVIGPPGLTQILEELEQLEGIKIAEFETGKNLNLTTIFVNEKKLEYDIELPILSPRIVIREFNADDLDIDEVKPLGVPLENKVLETEYVAVDMLKGVEVVKRTWGLPVPQDTKAVIAYYTDLILKQLRINGAFATFYPLVKQYVSARLFETPVELEDPRVLYALSAADTQKKMVDAFVEAFKNISYVEREPEPTDTIKLSDTPPFVWQMNVYPANKCIFNYAPCDNAYEVDFAKFLDQAEDVKAFCKLPGKVGFFIEYQDKESSRRMYYPDFIVLTTGNEHVLVETKGLEDVNVQYKDARAVQWCQDAEKNTGNKWRFVRVDQKVFEQYPYNKFREIMAPRDDKETRLPF
jgi:type III restriction enzyme